MRLEKSKDRKTPLEEIDLRKKKLHEDKLYSLILHSNKFLFMKQLVDTYQGDLSKFKDENGDSLISLAVQAGQH